MVQPRSLPVSPTKSGKPDTPFWRAMPSFIRTWQRLHFGVFLFMAVTVTGFLAPLEFPFQPDAKRRKHQNQ
jgi:hypothetical protein